MDSKIAEGEEHGDECGDGSEETPDMGVLTILDAAAERAMWRGERVSASIVEDVDLARLVIKLAGEIVSVVLVLTLSWCFLVEALRGFLEAVFVDMMS